MTDKEYIPSSPVMLVKSRGDAEIAEDIKRRVIEAYRVILDLCDEANRYGMELQISSGKGALGKQVITHLRVIKIL